jgi:hypothetical protein
MGDADIWRLRSEGMELGEIAEFLGMEASEVADRLIIILRAERAGVKRRKPQAK